MKRKLGYILSVLFIFTVFNYTGIVNSWNDGNPGPTCGGLPLEEGFVCCHNAPIMGDECPHADEPEEGVRQCGDPCDGIKLNTCFPIIGDCIETKAGKTNPTNALPNMIGVLTKIIMSVILVVCLIFVIWAGILRSADKPDAAKKMLKRVAITIILLGFSGVILKLVNPNFFY